MELKKEKIMKALGIFYIVLGIVFTAWETKYFGNNFFPQSFEELMCDIGAFLMIILGYIFFKTKKIKNDSK